MLLAWSLKARQRYLLHFVTISGTLREYSWDKKWLRRQDNVQLLLWIQPGKFKLFCKPFSNPAFKSVMTELCKQILTTTYFIWFPDSKDSGRDGWAVVRSCSCILSGHCFIPHVQRLQIWKSKGMHPCTHSTTTYFKVSGTRCCWNAREHVTIICWCQTLRKTLRIYDWYPDGG